MKPKKVSFIDLINALSKAIYTKDNSEGFYSYENMRYGIILKQNNLTNYLFFLMMVIGTAVGSVFFPFLPVAVLGSAFLINNILRARIAENSSSEYIKQGLLLALTLGAIISLSILFPPLSLLITTLGIGFFGAASNFKSFKDSYSNMALYSALMLSMLSIAIIPLFPALFVFLPAIIIPLIPAVSVLIAGLSIFAYAKYHHNIAEKNYIKENEAINIRESEYHKDYSETDSETSESSYMTFHSLLFQDKENTTRQRSDSTNSEDSFFTCHEEPSEMNVSNKDRRDSSSSNTTNESLSEEENYHPTKK